ncbi:MAG: hypothetical protein MI861_11665 [Pirellulales bacterium]|nr:hypothetical protein [Pirellulales bacterium]
MIRLIVLTIALLAVPTFASGAEIVRYQLSDWKTKHIDDSKKADTIAKTLKKLGCELKKEQHNGHIDLKYRCRKWHEMKLDSHNEAHKWEKWLKEYHFKTEHKH